MKPGYRTMLTCQGRLRAATLEGNSSIVAGTMSFGIRVAGKRLLTLTSRRLAHDENVKQTFRNGILSIALGTDSHLSDIK